MMVMAFLIQMAQRMLMVTLTGMGWFPAAVDSETGKRLKYFEKIHATGILFRCFRLGVKHMI
jgi:hypothetical protein